MKSHPINPRRIEALVAQIAGEDFHAKRVLSVTNAVVGVIHAAALSIHAIGHGLAQAMGLSSKHAIKQVDRLLSNGALDVWSWFGRWVPHIVAQRSTIVVAMDWTEFDSDDHATIAINMITTHGRATPLLWKTVKKSQLKGQRNNHEDALLVRLHEVLPKGCKVTILADRGFGDQKLYAFCDKLGFDYIIRFRGGVHVESEDGESQSATEWVPQNGRTKVLRNALVTAGRYPVGAVVCIKARGMKEAWHLACSRAEIASTAVKLYARRFTIEETFRDQKDARYGVGLSATHISDPKRRDRLLLMFALAMLLITLLGAAGESLGMERLMKANTAKARSYSLFRQGCHYYGAIPQMKQERLEPLIARFGEYVRQQPFYTDVFGLL